MFQIVPFHIPVGTFMQRSHAYNTQSGFPLVHAFSGYQEVDRQPVVALVFEYPLREFEVTETIQKPDIETLHVERFRSDYRRAHGVLPFTDLKAGGDPPDFLVTTSGRVVKLDCTQCPLESQRLAHARFEEVRGAILKQPRERFDHLAGLLITMWFRDAESLQLPPSRRDHHLQDEIVLSLSNYRFDPRKELASIPQTFPTESNIEMSKEGFGYQGTRIQGGFLPSQFSTHTGFDLALSHPHFTRIAEVWATLRKAIKDHDQESIQELIVTFGGPNRNGYRYSSESLFFEFLYQYPEKIDPPSYLERVLLHDWSTGTVFIAWPDFRILVPKQFTGFSPGFYQFAQ